MKQKKVNKEPFKGIQMDMAPKMDTVQQHEWGYTVSRITHPKYRCCHCECIKTEDMISGEIIFVDKNSDVFDTEPPCITRTKQ